MPSETLSDGIFVDGRLRPLQNSFPSRQPKPKHRISAVFVPNTS
ncbi:TPA: hypothetical protein ACFOAD_001571 [Neisseria meningitidis]